MKVSYKWLGEYVDLTGVSPKELAEKMTLAGVEVEEIRPLASGTGLVIGKILSCLPHPDSDHLHVLQVDEGEGRGIHQIVCGAPNVRESLKVIVATEGALLPGITIKKSKIRGVESNGMCCSLLELGMDRKFLSEAQCAGIEELPEDAPVGAEPLSYLGLDDVVLELKLLANRSDMNAMLQVAQEASTLLHRELRLPKPPLIEGRAPSVLPSSRTEKCARFALAEARGVKIHPSPRWLRLRLIASGVRPINNIVDIGNYAMLLTGQPFNMYDLDKLPEGKLEARDDIEGEWEAMDGKKYLLKKGDISIASKGRTMCLGGVMTSMECAVDEGTRNILVESALFDGACVRRTSTRLGLQSESSQRFAKGIAPLQEEALAYALALVKELSEPDSLSGIALYGGSVPAPRKIRTSLLAINRRLGTSLDEDEVLSALESESFHVEKDGDALLVEVPLRRIDVLGEADISEEVIRLLGYGKVPSRLPALPPEGGLTPRQERKRALRRLLRHKGLTEALTYSLLPKEEEGSYPYLLEGGSLRVRNPLTEDRLSYRKSLLPSLIEAMAHNQARQVSDLAFFEMGEAFAKGKQGERLAIALMGERKTRSLMERAPYGFYDLKGILEDILQFLGIKDGRVRYVPLKTDRQEFHPGRSALVTLGKETLAVLGELHPSELKKRGLRSGSLMEIDLSLLLSLPGEGSKAKVPPRFPGTRRDLALLLGEGISFREVKECASRASRLIKDVLPFDEYRGEGIPAGKRSLAIALFLQDEGKTLGEEEIQEAVEKARKALEEKLGAEVRS